MMTNYLYRCIIPPSSFLLPPSSFLLPPRQVLEPTVQEWWPKVGDVDKEGKQNWPSTLPPMGGALDCSPYVE